MVDFRRIPLADRLALQSIPEPNSGCTLWAGAVGNHGYGVVGYKARLYRAHRLAWIEAHGSDPGPDLVVRHKCDNRLCINVQHLELGTQAQNIADKVKRNRQARGETQAKAKLTAESVRAIRLDKRLLREIAADYGISIAAASKVRRGDMWRHV